MKTALVLCFSFFAFLGISQDCHDYRTGKFINEDVDGEKAHIRRTEKYQFEYNPKTGSRLKLKVNWVDSCSFELQFVSANKVWKEKRGGNPDTSRILLISIIETGDDYYIQSAVWKDEDQTPYVSRMKLKK